MDPIICDAVAAIARIPYLFGYIALRPAGIAT